MSYRVLSDLLWGEFAQKPKDPAASLRELMVYVHERYGNEWRIEDFGRAFRIMPRVRLPRIESKPGIAAGKKKAAVPKHGLGGRSIVVTRHARPPPDEQSRG